MWVSVSLSPLPPSSSLLLSELYLPQLSDEVKLEGEPGDVLQTFQLMSDGKTLYWLCALQTQETVTHPVSGDKLKQYPLFLHTIHVLVSRPCLPVHTMLV